VSLEPILCRSGKQLVPFSCGNNMVPEFPGTGPARTIKPSMKKTAAFWLRFRELQGQGFGCVMSLIQHCIA
jgi:hypothetical protein